MNKLLIGLIVVGLIYILYILLKMIKEDNDEQTQTHVWLNKIRKLK